MRQAKPREPRDYIVFPLDVPSFDSARRYVDVLADHVGLFKVGLELFIRCGLQIIQFIRSSGTAGVFLDLKIHDIPVTVERALSGIAELGVAFATVHCGETPQMLEAAVTGSRGRVAVLGVTVLTSVSDRDFTQLGWLPDRYPDLSSLVLHRARMAYEAGCAGVVCSGLETKSIKEAFGNRLLIVTPGIRSGRAAVNRDDQQRVVTPAQAVRNGSDYLVIGRPIRDAKDPQSEALRLAQEIEKAL